MIEEQNQKWIAKITPVNPAEAGKVICLRNILVHALTIVTMQAGYVGTLFLAFYLADSNQMTLSFMLGAISIVWLLFALVMTFVYPEWPINLRLCHQLRNRVGERDNDWRSGRIVELVPRERWQKAALETAIDLLLFNIDKYGITMNGDRFRYELPGESILGSEVKSIKPTGWLCSVHFVVIFVRCQDGVIDLPIAYRDFQLGSLRSSRRLQAANELAAEIQLIARGAEQQPFSTPLAEVPRHQPLSNNPYAAPSCLDESQYDYK